jgi:hypothetical protein
MGAINSFASVVIREQDCTSLPSSGFSQPSHKSANASHSGSMFKATTFPLRRRLGAATKPVPALQRSADAPRVSPTSCRFCDTVVFVLAGDFHVRYSVLAYADHFVDAFG